MAATDITRLPASSSALLVGKIHQRSGLSQAELARRAGIPRSVLNVYIRGHREPGGDALIRIASAGGLDLNLRERRPPVDPERAGRILVQVLELAEALPFRPRAEMQFPALADRLAERGGA
jgi:transcriptional regulator with XRE-family HTH domain